MRITGALAAACLLTACGSSATGDSGAGEAENAKQSAKCLDVKSAMAKAIAKGAAGVKMQAGDVAAVRSSDFSEVYFIAMRFAADGGGDEVGVWASNSLTPGRGILMSVDGFAKEFTDWPDASQTDAAISGADPAVAEAKSCL